MAPNDVQFIAVQSVEWLGFDCVKERSSLNSGRTDILGVFTGRGGAELVTKLHDIQHRLVDLEHQLAEAQKQLERRQKLVANFLMRTVMAYRAKHPTKSTSFQHRSQACADYLVLDTNQVAHSDSHPGCIVVPDNYNQHIICAPSRPPGHPTRDKVPPVINTMSTSDTAPERAAAACLIKALLRDRCRVLAERAATIFDLQGRGADGSGGNGGGMGCGSGSATIPYIYSHSHNIFPFPVMVGPVAVAWVQMKGSGVSILTPLTA
ncbi:g5137 [Coccomyxa elongata]